MMSDRYKFMNRYKFKGYDTKYKCWHFGGFVLMKDWYGEPVKMYRIIEDDCVEDNDIGYSYKVEPDSIGQFIGRFDMYGKEIYEHDLIRIYNGITDEEKRLFEVVWYNKESAYFAVSGKTEIALGDLVDWEIEVVGNKYDKVEVRKDE